MVEMEKKTVETVEKDAALQEAFAEIKRTVESQNAAQAAPAAGKEAAEVKAASKAAEKPAPVAEKKAGEEAAEKGGKAGQKAAAPKDEAKKAAAAKPPVSKLADKKEEKKAAARKPSVRKAPVKKEEGKASAGSSGKKAAAKDRALESAIILEWQQKKINMEEIRKKALEAAKKAKPDVSKVEIYVVAEQNAAYYVVDGEGKAEYKIEL